LVPDPVDFLQYGAAKEKKASDSSTTAAVEAAPAGPVGSQNSGESYTDFEYF
jgi:hypothetical protein